MKLNWKENWPIILIVGGLITVITRQVIKESTRASKPSVEQTVNDHWVAPSLYLDRELEGAERELVIYGQNLVAYTAEYFGPRGSVKAITNGMNCQNCHLQAGRKAWGNNFGAVNSTYPKWRDRSGSVETIPKRVNDCFERSLNGVAVDSNSREMRAIVAYIQWLGQKVEKGQKPSGSGITELPYLNRAADPERGALVYSAKCQSCHGANGEGVANPDEIGYAYPPLWGPFSYNDGAGLYRLSRFAGYVKDNMPFNQATHHSPALSNEEAWDVAAFVNSRPRPSKDLSGDWPNISKKPIDHPFGPYDDGFTEQQHKFGPFEPILAARKKRESQTTDHPQ